MTKTTSSPGCRPPRARRRWRVLPAVLVAGAATAAMPPSAAAPAASADAAPRVDYPCTQYLTQWANKTVRSTWSFHLDAAGRPARATTLNLSAGTSPRTTCETTVGRWGGSGSDGGHLIASTLKGVSKRINLVPMRKKINIGIYKMFENGAKKCLKAGKNQTRYESTVTYPDARDVVPKTLTLSMIPKAKGGSGTEIKLVIPNEDITKRKENALKKQLNTGLTNNKCGTVASADDEPAL
ncbi:DNA/RNA non-specific endonuclease [Streptomyces chrestomyceticus]|uniref:DNA/RNA non-specific endonuclease n=1 Tax=Streptomyces chrestomyceticus TaxID=68185 RepID=UPI00369C1D9F